MIGIGIGIPSRRRRTATPGQPPLPLTPTLKQALIAAWDMQETVDTEPPVNSKGEGGFSWAMPRPSVVSAPGPVDGILSREIQNISGQLQGRRFANGASADPDPYNAEVFFGNPSGKTFRIWARANFAEGQRLRTLLSCATSSVGIPENNTGWFLRYGDANEAGSENQIVFAAVDSNGVPSSYGVAEASQSLDLLWIRHELFFDPAGFLRYRGWIPDLEETISVDLPIDGFDRTLRRVTIGGNQVLSNNSITWFGGRVSLFCAFDGELTPQQRAEDLTPRLTSDLPGDNFVWSEVQWQFWGDAQLDDSFFVSQGHFVDVGGNVLHVMQDERIRVVDLDTWEPVSEIIQEGTWHQGLYWDGANYWTGQQEENTPPAGIWRVNQATNEKTLFPLNLSLTRPGDWFGNITVAVDDENDLIAIRARDSSIAEGPNYLFIGSFSNLVADSENWVADHSFPIADRQRTGTAFQAVEVRPGYVLVMSGTGNPEADDCYIYAYDFQGRVLWIHRLEIGRDLGGILQTYEPEGLHIYTDTTGQTWLTLNIVIDAGGLDRKWRYWRAPLPGLPPAGTVFEAQS